MNRAGRTLASAMLVLAAGLGGAGMAGAQVLEARLDLGVLAKIRDEGMNHSRVDSLAQALLDGIGSRLTGSTGMRRAQDWAATTLQGWGLSEVALEPWDSLFGRGWDRVSYAGRFIAPYEQPLRAEPQGWSGSTRGTVTCNVVRIDIQDSTQLGQYAGKLKGACVMWQPWNPIGPEYTSSPRRLEAESLLVWSTQRPVPPQPGADEDRRARFRDAQARTQAALRFLRQEKAAVYLVPSGWTYGILRTGGHPDGRLARDSAYEPTPTLMVSHEQYGQMSRLIERGVTPRLEVNVQNRWTNPDHREFTVVAEIPGTDLKDEIVMIGAHFDSWHSGTGATDDGAGSIAMMEAMRILKALELPLRRTARIGLWSGEEQRLLGSRAYVRVHESEMPRISAYLNIDNGSGRLRGVWGQGNEEAVKVLDQMLLPFRDAGIVASRLHNTGGTDHLSFDRVGVPGFQFIQDPLEYGIRSHHSYVDTYERLVIEDLQQAATIVAWTVYTIANRDEMMPRKPVAPSGTN
ncbi:MAG: M20/M25/M40 family metallo-hydrolase [Gemmatimonadales bacterium]|nr:MAG: M20/M25/M40 family metallo-hydrolase [Gemmatimonadales bacterium]